MVDTEIHHRIKIIKAHTSNTTIEKLSNLFLRIGIDQFIKANPCLDEVIKKAKYKISLNEKLL